VSWLREQEWFGGALGVIGTSYLGYTAWALAASAPPELRAMVADGALAPYPFFYGSGAFALQNVLVVSAAMLPFQRGPVALAAAMMRLRRNQRRVATTLPLTEAYRAALGGRSEFFEQRLTDPDPASPYWTSRDLTSVTANLAVPVSLVTGWDDVMLDQTLEQYRRLKEAGGEVRLVVGPWTHSSIFGKGYPKVVPRAVEEFRARLSGEPGRLEGPPVRIHVSGCGQWRDLPAWPPPQVRAQSWYLDAGGALRGQPPEQAGSSSFRYDPSDPTPSAGGPVSARLLIHASNPYHDVFARLCDVDPRGRSRNICDGLIRHQPGGRPAGAAAITVPMSSAAYRFGAGHRIRLQVSGGAHPRYARNTGTADPQATATRLVPADIQLLHDPEAPCTLSLPVANEITSLTPAAGEGFKGNSADDAERQRKSVLDHRVAKN
jgi:hypothetical protein